MNYTFSVSSHHYKCNSNVDRFERRNEIEINPTLILRKEGKNDKRERFIERKTWFQIERKIKEANTSILHEITRTLI